MVQDAVDPETDEAFVAPRLDMDVAGPLVEGVLQKPVDDLHDVRVVRLRRLHGAKLEHLLEVRDGRHLDAGLGRLLRRPRNRVELELITREIRGVAHHPPNAASAHRLRQHRLPLEHVRLTARDDDVLVVHLEREDVVALGELVTHHVRDGVDVHLERIDAHVRMTRPLG